MENQFSNYSDKIGILLTNLGTPDSPTSKSLRKYLNQFLMDRRVVDLPRALWVPILKLIILNIRPKKSAKLYKKIWTDEGSPLLAISKKIIENIDKRFENKNNFFVALGMRYGSPSIQNAMRFFKEKEVSKILVFPLYPQSGSPTTSSTFDAVNNFLKTEPWIPHLRFISGYHDESDYIELLAKSVEESFSTKGKPEKLIFSFHGMPLRYLKNGDPYYCFSHKTARLVAEKLKLKKSEYDLAFQSRFGREEWLKPYIEDIIVNYNQEGVKSLQIISPAFSVDCLETLEEINIQYRKLFFDGGGKKFHYIPCLNDSKGHIKMIAKIIEKNIQGWT
jgi:ferrochelatase